MKLIFILVAAVASCTATEPQISSTNGEVNYEYHEVGETLHTHSNLIKVGKLFVDGCMYITTAGYHEMILTHAGNCPNQIHQQSPCK